MWKQPIKVDVSENMLVHTKGINEYVMPKNKEEYHV